MSLPAVMLNFRGWVVTCLSKVGICLPKTALTKPRNFKAKIWLPKLADVAIELKDDCLTKIDTPKGLTTTRQS